MEAWVIKSEKAKYYAVTSNVWDYERYWTSDLLYCHHFRTFKSAQDYLTDQICIERDSVCKHFENCKVVKVEIREVEE